MNVPTARAKAVGTGATGLLVRTVGITRATMQIGLANLAHNMQRRVWLGAKGVSE